jgi:hypothetical protein
MSSACLSRHKRQKFDGEDIGKVFSVVFKRE